MNEIMTGDKTWIYFYEPDDRKKKTRCRLVIMTEGLKLLVELIPKKKSIMYAKFLITRALWLEFVYQRAGVSLY